MSEIVKPSESGQVDETPMVAVRQRWTCPEDGCGGEMRHQGVTLTSNPPFYPHACDECGHSVRLVRERYPRTIHRPADA